MQEGLRGKTTYHNRQILSNSGKIIVAEHAAAKTNLIPRRMVIEVKHLAE